MITATSISITLSPIEAVGAGFAIGVGIYAGMTATAAAVKFAEDSVDVVKAKIAAKKAEKEKTEGKVEASK